MRPPRPWPPARDSLRAIECLHDRVWFHEHAVRGWFALLWAMLTLTSCGVGLPGRGLDQLGEPCDPERAPLECHPLVELAGGWCDRRIGECVIPCGADCEHVDGICSTEGVCYARPT